jgi:hypothetical protein
MDPVRTAAIAPAVVSAAGTVLAAWVRGRAQRQPQRAGQQPTGRGKPVPTAATSTVVGRELRPDDCQ